MLTYDYYVFEYGGIKVSSQDFPRYSKRATNYLEYITFNKDLTQLSDKIEEKVNFALSEVMDVIKDYDERLQALNISQKSILSDGVKTESIKSHSVTFQDVKGSEQSELLKGAEEKIFSILRTALLPTGLLSRAL